MTPTKTRSSWEALIFDGRNLFEPSTVKSFGIEYHAIGRGDSVRAAITAD